MRYLAVFIILGQLAACGESKPPEKTFADPQVRAFEKARGVQKTVEAGGEQRRDAVDGQTGNSGGER